MPMYCEKRHLSWKFIFTNQRQYHLPKGMKWIIKWNYSDSVVKTLEWMDKLTICGKSTTFKQFDQIYSDLRISEKYLLANQYSLLKLSNFFILQYYLQTHFMYLIQQWLTMKYLQKSTKLKYKRRVLHREKKLTMLVDKVEIWYSSWTPVPSLTWLRFNKDWYESKSL